MVHDVNKSGSDRANDEPAQRQTKTKFGSQTMNLPSRATVKTSTLMFLASIVWASGTYADVRVIDGDTIEKDGVVFRIEGIDAPEFGQKCQSPHGSWECGKAAVQAMAGLVEGKDVQCVGLGEDGYGRTIAQCYSGEIDIGAELVRTGMAWAFVKYSDSYTDQEAEARKSKTGIWQGEAVPAWEFRSSRWDAAQQDAPAGCPIKGNISENGKIYHAPWSPWYSRTRINEAKGERWFCSEADAIAAGWRAPKWR